MCKLKWIANDNRKMKDKYDEHEHTHNEDEILSLLLLFDGDQK